MKMKISKLHMKILFLIPFAIFTTIHLKDFAAPEIIRYFFPPEPDHRIDIVISTSIFDYIWISSVFYVAFFAPINIILSIGKIIKNRQNKKQLTAFLKMILLLPILNIEIGILFRIGSIFFFMSHTLLSICSISFLALTIDQIIRERKTGTNS